MPQTASADQIILKNGKVISSAWVEEVGGQVRYEYFGGIVSLARERVEKIVFEQGETPTETEDGPTNSDNKADLPDDRDLTTILQQKIRPRSPIEAATLGTVSIDTGVSFGSGFFVGENGFILTNRHVVRGDDSAEEQVVDKFSELQRVLNDDQSHLDRDSDRLNRARDNFTRNWNLYLEQVSRARQQRDLDTLADHRTRLLDRNWDLQEWEKALNDKKRQHAVNIQEYQTRLSRFNGDRDKLKRQNTYQVILADETRLQATLHEVSRNHDLAILKISGYRTPGLVPGRTAAVRQGDPLYAIGSPVRLKNSVTSGVFSGTTGGLIQTNAQIYPGSSGGPLVTEDGKVIGINTMKKITRGYEGLGFAIPIETALQEFRGQLGNY